jgi:hypothetical protein
MKFNYNPDLDIKMEFRLVKYPTSLNEEKVFTMEELQFELQYYAKGDDVNLIVQKYSEQGYTEVLVNVELVDLYLLEE